MKQYLHNRYIITFCLITSLVLSLTFFSSVHAATTFNNASENLGQVAPLGGYTQEQGDVSSVIGNIIKGALAISGVIFFALMVYAGILWMTARGKDDQVEKARNTMIAAVIGLIILVASYAITSFVQNQILKGNNPGAGPSAPNAAGEDPIGCCIDWVKSQPPDPLQPGSAIPAARWTTKSDCKKWGENNGSGDFHSGSEGVGNWTWENNSKTYEQCVQTLP